MTYRGRTIAACALLHTVAMFAVMLVTPAFAQNMDFSGGWSPLYHEDGPERIPGPDLGDYSGIPVNDAARMRGDSYDSARPSVVLEYQCRQHGGDYSMRGLASMRITRDIDPTTQAVTAFHTRIGFHDMQRTIYLDGRAHPHPQAAHTWQGFSTGVWEGNMLTITTTHLKESYLRRNGLPASDKRTFTEHWVRHGDYLTVVTVIEDPVFLTERLVRSESWALDPGMTMGFNPCEYAPELPAEAGHVPNYLPGKNPYLSEFAERYGLPIAGARGGAQTMYPEYRQTMGPPAATPKVCTLFCRCMNTGGFCPESP
jgi:hypothetical protein